jgi:hypothetical protein
MSIDDKNKALVDEIINHIKGTREDVKEVKGLVSETHKLTKEIHAHITKSKAE